MARVNDFQDILFSKARVVLNNNVKRLWFKINPFLEKKDTLKGFKHPEQLSRFVKLLQSSVVCEHYFSDETKAFQDVTIEEFWDFLYSDKWSNGCSIRILEGQLLDYLITALYVLEKTKIINSHYTFALARNERKKRSCFRPSNEEKSCEMTEETLLLEFTYYGKKTAKMEKKNKATFQTEDSAAMEILAKSKKRKKSLSEETSYTKRKNSLYSESPGDTEEEEDITRQLEHMVRSGCMEDDPIEIKSVLQEWQLPPTGQPSQNTRPNVEVTPHIASDDTKSSQVGYDLADDFWSLEIFETEEEFYLGENLTNDMKEDISVHKKLRMRLREKQKLREKKKIEQQTWEKQRQKLPQYKQIDFNSFEMKKRRPSYVGPGKVPTFEEFLKVLEEEQKFDPRFRRAKQLSRRIAMQYNIQTSKDALIFQPARDKEKKVPEQCSLPPINAKTNYKRFAEEVGGVTDSEACKNYVIQQGAHRRTAFKKVSMITDEDDRGRTVSLDSGTPVHEYDISRDDSTELEPPAILLTTPSGNMSALEQSESEDSPGDNITPSIPEVKDIPKVDETESPKKEKRMAKKKPPVKVSKQKVKNRQSPKRGPVVQQLVESSSDSESELEPEHLIFDTSKLNIKYSFERIKGKQVKKKPSFYEVLKKYYKMQRILTKFGGGTKKGGRRRGIFGRLINMAPSEEKEEEADPIGKLRKFDFLEHKPSQPEKKEQVSFAVVSMLDFTTRVLKSLDDFVVRKEQVVSDYCPTSSTTITFTRKSVFKMKNY